MRSNLQRSLIGLGLVIILISACEPKQSGVKGLSNLLWGRYQEQIKLSREDAVAKYNYCPTGGCVVRLEEVEIRPKWVKPGDSITLTTSYTILTPEKLAIPVTISRAVRYQGQSVGQTKVTETRTPNGTWENQVDINLPPQAEPGTYTLVVKVTTGYGMAQKSATFTVW
ncbi:MAG: hypothetical protein JRI57_04805 [Deltaproteobacteria bacterium]|nr:hypothetical protein [Deltaproteobacteria bacterium]MBW1952571.1 hypothetical protein [Deltaproteobacteria bacterium]MBW1986138.1 hypothetical protein [Deltaproteobacteria bacterium]MBW2134176.1 hypothetical protein [Deltaproteobacteria bacterium]